MIHLQLHRNPWCIEYRHLRQQSPMGPLHHERPSLHPLAPLGLLALLLSGLKSIKPSKQVETHVMYIPKKKDIMTYTHIHIYIYICMYICVRANKCMLPIYIWQTYTVLQIAGRSSTIIFAHDSDHGGLLFIPRDTLQGTIPTWERENHFKSFLVGDNYRLETIS